MLICLIARRAFMLTKENLKDGALYISKTKFEYWDLWDFFEDLNFFRSEPNCYPVILVVDEVGCNRMRLSHSDFITNFQ